MRNSLVGQSLAAASITILCVALAGCPSGNRLEGTYRATTGAPIVLDFKGDKVTVRLAGESETLDYKVDGDKVTIINPKEGNLELTRNSDGSLNTMWGVLTKGG